LRNIRLDLQYDGTNYSGWQIQKNSITIQGKIEDVLYKLTNEKIKITGSGRTDAGVHALHQVASFKTNSKIPVNKFHKAINSLLPKDIRILKSKDVDFDFNARFSAKKRTYKYIISDDYIQSPFNRLYSWHRKGYIDISILYKVMEKAIGKHDFSNLCSINDDSKSKVRTIYDIKISRDDNNLIFINIEANAFLRKMVRIIVGTSIMILEKGLDHDYLYTILKSSHRDNNIFTAKPHGLFLYKVEY
jgi:tRNA pseudouridine38-40 synthase